ncbi:heme biosynthesis protein HemY [Aquibium carbonis]|uniref:Heme biosynthesis protein HemY n=1 Tax=Aquibium carbonis TaxID=2495581 RepID=A0A3R9YIB8_9HYPH|nr:heme biosynthesis protein HemY [Aquibium carbonis]RST88372.1 heme biosynthesis protein HemY [Aquibium carbonis]
MLRILLFILFVFALGLGFAWLADRPGDLVLTFDGYQYELTLMAAAVFVTAIVAAVMISWWLLKAIWNSPYTVSRYFRVRRRDRGYQALSTGMIAAGAGDGALARQMNRQAAKLISSDQEPLIHLLDAQASLLEGDHAAARKKFEAMLEDPEMRVLGLRGLYLEAQRLGDREVARHYAERAAEIAPQLGWASGATLEARSAEGDWDGALALLETQRSTKLIDAAKANRLRAVLLTAKAKDMLERDPLAARNAAIEANRLAPDLVPAAVFAAKALFRQGDLRKGAKILETAWRKTAHPEIAEAYVNARHGDSTLDHLARAKKLKSQRENNALSALTVARVALEAGELGLARAAAEEALRIDPREGGYLMMADIEEADTGDQGRIRQWLARAVRAPRDPVWIADGVVSERWAPLSPVTGKLDAFEWKTPVERPLHLVEHDDDDAPLAEPVLLGRALTIPPTVIETDMGEETIIVEPKPETKGETSAEPGKPSAKTAVPAGAPAMASPPAAPAAHVPETEEPVEPARQPEPIAPVLPTAANDSSATPPDEDVAVAPRPDDPGVDPTERDETETKRFRLF